MSLQFEEMFRRSFSDEWRANRELLVSRLVEGQSAIGRERACKMGFGRYLSNPAVISEEVFAVSNAVVGVRARGRQLPSVFSYEDYDRNCGDVGPGYGTSDVPEVLRHPVVIRQGAETKPQYLDITPCWLSVDAAIDHHVPRRTKLDHRVFNPLPSC